jgi:serine/threonine protein kinase
MLLTESPRIGDRYAVEGLLATGGTAQVLRAQDLATGRAVAVKILQIVDPNTARRFRTEVEVLSWLDHPSLVRLCDRGLHDGRPYLVMELVEGPSLADVIDDGPLPVPRTVSIGRQLALGLAHAHALDVVHRDVKPENVLFEADSQHARLADFGIARFGDASRVTAQGTCIGTAAYLAPEQLDGVVGSAVDIYALGLVLLECITGEPCYDGTAVEAAFARLTRPPEVPPGLPPWLGHTLSLMTAPDPGRRPPAAAVADMLRRTTEPAPPIPTEPEAPPVEVTAALPLHPTEANLTSPPLDDRRSRVARMLVTAAAVVVATLGLWLVAGRDLRVTAADRPTTPPVTSAEPGTTTSSLPPPTQPAPAKAKGGEGKGQGKHGKSPRK